MLGFNSIRVAFAFDDNWGINSPVVDWTGECTVPTDTQIRKTLVPGKNASTTIKSNADTLPPLAPPDVPEGICNSDWPQKSTYDRFIWVIDYLISQVCCFPWALVTALTLMQDIHTLLMSYIWCMMLASA